RARGVEPAEDREAGRHAKLEVRIAHGIDTASRRRRGPKVVPQRVGSLAKCSPRFHDLSERKCEMFLAHCYRNSRRSDDGGNDKADEELDQREAPERSTGHRHGAAVLMTSVIGCAESRSTITTLSTLCWILSAPMLRQTAETPSALSAPAADAQPARCSSSNRVLTEDAAWARRWALVSSRRLATPVAAMPSTPTPSSVMAASASTMLLPPRRWQRHLVTATDSSR